MPTMPRTSPTGGANSAVIHEASATPLVGGGAEGAQGAGCGSGVGASMVCSDEVRGVKCRRRTVAWASQHVVGALRRSVGGRASEEALTAQNVTQSDMR